MALNIFMKRRTEKPEIIREELKRSRRALIRDWYYLEERIRDISDEGEKARRAGRTEEAHALSALSEKLKEIRSQYRRLFQFFEIVSSPERAGIRKQFIMLLDNMGPKPGSLAQMKLGAGDLGEMRESWNMLKALDRSMEELFGKMAGLSSGPDSGALDEDWGPRETTSMHSSASQLLQEEDFPRQANTAVEWPFPAAVGSIFFEDPAPAASEPEQAVSGLNAEEEKQAGGDQTPEPEEQRHSIESISRVKFSALSDPAVKRKNYYSLRVFMYGEGQEAELERVKAELRELSRETLSAASVPVSRGQMVTVSLSSPAAVIQDGELTLPWEGTIREFAFSYLVPADVETENIPITARVYIDRVIAARLEILIPVRQERTAPSVVRTDIREAFMSYSSSDRTDVLKIAQGMHKARPDLHLFVDVEALRSGEDWKSVIDAKISSSDLLYLCWSRAASRSEWVDYEWRSAYRMKGASFIEPIPLEPPALCRPPEELAGKHFSDPDMMMSLAEMYIGHMRGDAGP